jgi:hypothetical protein
MHASHARVDGILLACDNPVSADWWMDRLASLGRPIFQAEKRWHPSAMRQTSLADAMLDMVLLSRCDRIIGSTYSSFGVLASVIGGVDYEITGLSKQT